MSKKGGYFILDFRKLAIVEAGTTISGLYTALDKNKAKQVIVSGIVIGSAAYFDTSVEVTKVDGKFKFTAYGYNFEISSADLVTATVIETPSPFPTFDLGNAPLKSDESTTTYDGIGAFITANVGKIVILKNLEVIDAETEERIGYKGDVFGFCQAESIYFTPIDITYFFGSYYLAYTATDKLAYVANA